jgi:hypothetical protein
MSKSSRRRLKGVVSHPRYGDTVLASGLKVSESEVRGSFWRYSAETIFPESAIKADTDRQNYSIYSRGYYVDILKRCRTCSRHFLFFAREQRHWYEELGFHIDADCVHCPQCRRSEHQLRRRFHRYSDNVKKADLSEPDLAVLVGDAVYLWEAGILRDEQKFRRLRNRACRRIPGDKCTSDINAIVSELPKSGMPKPGEPGA